MTEREYKIRTPDGNIIDGILRGTINKPLILLVHGLCGHMNEALHYNAARYFEKSGFSSFRFNLYSWNKNNRKLHECTLQTHGKDIDTVLKFLTKKGVKKIFAAGHSYGFPSLLHSKSGSIRALASWDGSVLPRNYFLKLPKVKTPVKGRLIDEGYLTVMGEEMFREEGRVNSKKLAKEFGSPIKLIVVPKGNDSVGKSLYKILPQEKDLAVINGATHNFTEDGKQEELYKETVSWFNKFT